MTQSDIELLFSKDRLKSFKDNEEHKNNFLLMQALAPRLGIIEITTRNKAANIPDINDSVFVSHQTFGYWAKVINERSIHNKILDLEKIDFRNYSDSNRKTKLKNYQKVRVCYDLLVSIRNRAFHFENLFKIKQIEKDNKVNVLPRISTFRNGEVIGVMPNRLELFIDDIMVCFNENLREYLK